MARPNTAAVRLLAGEREPVFVATTGNITLSGLQEIDGEDVTAGKRVLVWQQTDATENGIWDASSGTWYRSPDARQTRTINKGITVHVQAGDTLAGNVYAFQTLDPDIGEDEIEITLYLSDDFFAEALDLLNYYLTLITNAGQSILDSVTNPVFTSKIAAEAHDPDTAPGYIILVGYSTVGDHKEHPALYKKVVGEPAHAGKVQIAEGSWYELQNTTVTPEMFGGSETAASTNNTVFPAMCDYLESAWDGGEVLLDKLYHKSAVFEVTQSNITFRSNQRGGIWLKGTPGGGNHLIHLIEVSNIQIRGLTLRGDEGVAREDAQGAIHVDTVNSLIVQDCHIHDLNTFIFVFYGNDVHIRGNRAERLTADGIDIRDGTENFEVVGNFLDDISDDTIIVFASPALTPDPFPIYKRPKGGTISNNVLTRIRGTGAPIRIVGADYVNVENNIINGAWGPGIAITSYEADEPSTYINIVGNTVIDYARRHSSDDFYEDSPTFDQVMCGITVSHASHSLVANNIIVCRSVTGFGRGIYITQSAAFCVVRGNAVDGAYVGIMVDNGVLLAGVTENMEGLTIENNEIVNVEAFGIYVVKAGGTANIMRNMLIRNNSIRDSSPTDAVRILDVGADVVRLKGNFSFGSGAFTVTNSAGTTSTDNTVV